MPAVLLDTHAWVWSFADEAQLSPPARAAIAAADVVYVSPISFFEIGQKVRHGKWPEMAALAPRLADILREQGGVVAPFTAEIALHASLRQWDHRDPFDRLLAATSESLAVPLVSQDPVLAELASVHRVW